MNEGNNSFAAHYRQQNHLVTQAVLTPAATSSAASPHCTLPLGIPFWIERYHSHIWQETSYSITARHTASQHAVLL
jgi:hypothetical protein